MMNVSRLPEHICSWTIHALEDFRSHIQLVALTLEPSRTKFVVRTTEAEAPDRLRSWPERRHAKVADLEAPIAGHEDVGGLEVEMDDSIAMHKGEALLN
jgi:hypothetical protein